MNCLPPLPQPPCPGTWLFVPDYADTDLSSLDAPIVARQSADGFEVARDLFFGTEDRPRWS